MARAAKPKKEISMEEALWKSADKLRGSVEPAEYKHVVLIYSSLNLLVTSLRNAVIKFCCTRRKVCGYEAVLYSGKCILSS